MKALELADMPKVRERATKAVVQMLAAVDADRERLGLTWGGLATACGVNRSNLHRNLTRADFATLRMYCIVRAALDVLLKERGMR